MKKAISYDAVLCSGCGACVSVCSLYHFGECGPSLSAISLKTYPTDAYTTEVVTCHQCLTPSCREACPTEAMYVDEMTETTCIDSEECIGCGACAEACQYNDKGQVLKQRPGFDAYFKCDLCGGNPQCITCCPMGALSLKEIQ